MNVKNSFFVFSIILITSLSLTTFAQVGNEFSIEVSTDSTFAIAFAEDGSKYMIVYRREKGFTGADVVAQFHSKSDHSLIGNPIVLGSTVIPAWDFDLGILQAAFDGERFLVVWTNGTNGGIQYRFIDAQTFELSNLYSFPTLPSYLSNNGLHFNSSLNKFLLISSIKQPSGYYIIKNFIQKNGFLESSSSVISFATRKENCTAFGDSKYLVVSIKEASGGDDYEVWGRVLNQDGSTSGSEFLIDGSNYPSDNPVFVTFVNGKFICVFPDQEPTGWNLYARIINSDGTVQPERYLVSNSGWLTPCIIKGDNSLLFTSTSVNPDPNFCFVLGKFYDFNMNSLSDEFIIYEPKFGKIPMSGFGAYGNNKFYVYTNRVNLAFSQDSSIFFTNGDIYGVSINAPTGVDDEINIPVRNELHQNYPNPFNPSTKISFSLSNSSLVKIKLYDLLGNEIATLLNEFKSAGKHSFELNANHLNLQSGVYFYRMITEDYQSVRKMVYLK